MHAFDAQRRILPLRERAVNIEAGLRYRAEQRLDKENSDRKATKHRAELKKRIIQDRK
jgi:hypothetical protein